jgi:hypothetical protein
VSSRGPDHTPIIMTATPRGTDSQAVLVLVT